MTLGPLYLSCREFFTKTRRGSACSTVWAKNEPIGHWQRANLVPPHPRFICGTNLQNQKLWDKDKMFTEKRRHRQSKSLRRQETEILCQELEDNFSSWQSVPSPLPVFVSIRRSVGKNSLPWKEGGKTFTGITNGNFITCACVLHSIDSAEIINTDPQFQIESSAFPFPLCVGGWLAIKPHTGEGTGVDTPSNGRGPHYKMAGGPKLQPLSSLGPRSHRTCQQICVQTLWCCLQAVWTLPLTTICSIIYVCLLRGALRPVWTGPRSIALYWELFFFSCFFLTNFCQVFKPRRTLFNVMEKESIFPSFAPTAQGFETSPMRIARGSTVCTGGSRLIWIWSIRIHG